MGHLYVYYKDEKRLSTRGFHKISVSQDYHPYYSAWIPFEEVPMGYSATFVHSAYNIVKAVIDDTELDPLVPTFEDGYKANVICDAILKSAETGKKETVRF